MPVAAITAPDQYDFYSNRVWGEVQDRMLEAFGLFGGQPADPALHTAGNVAVQVDRLRRQLLPFRSADDGTSGIQSPVTYPKSSDPFPSKLAGLAAMLAANLPMRVVALSAPGEYDTHSAEAGALSQGLQLTSDSLLAFQRDLEARGIADRVLVHVWSEFGRRAQENGSAGTDHGAAGTGFLIGTRVKGQMIGEFPGLQSGLDADGNLVETADFRAVYAALLEQWLGVDAGRVIPGSVGVPAAGADRLIVAAPPPARVQVVAHEFSFVLSRRTIKAGPAIVELANDGEDAHDLRMQRVGGSRVYAWPTVQPGRYSDREYRLLPGTYVLWCSLANHRELGMNATLVVRR